MEVKRNINPQEICNKIREGNISALSKAITLCESNNDSDREISSQILANLKLKKKNTRPGRNPMTGQVIPVSARTIVKFYASSKFKSMVLD